MPQAPRNGDHRRFLIAWQGMATTKQKTVLAIVLTAIVAITPSFFGYLQARQEIAAKYKQGRGEAAHSYETLVASLKDLQTASLAQHDYIVKLEGQLSMLTRVITQITTSTSGLRMTALPALPALDKPPLRPNLPAPPDFDVVQMRPSGP